MSDKKTHGHGPDKPPIVPTDNEATRISANFGVVEGPDLDQEALLQSMNDLYEALGRHFEDMGKSFKEAIPEDFEERLVNEWRRK